MSLLVMDLMGEELHAAKVLVSERVGSGKLVDPLFEITDASLKAKIEVLYKSKLLKFADISGQYDYHILLLEDREGREHLLYPGDFLIFPKAGDVYCLTAAAAKHLVNVE